MLKMSKEKAKKISTVIAIVLLLVLSVAFIVNADDSYDKVYVVDVLDPKDQATDAKDDGDIRIQKQILKDSETEPFYDSLSQTYQVTARNINLATIQEVAILVDSSYSVRENNGEAMLKNAAKDLVTKVFAECSGAKIQIFNGAGSKSSKLTYSTVNLTTLHNTITNLAIGDGASLEAGITAATSSFSAGANIDRYLILFTDTTDNVKDLLYDANSNGIRVFTIAQEDLMSNSFYEGNAPITGRVQMIYSSGRPDADKKYTEYDPDEIVNVMNDTLMDIELTDTFTTALADYFNFELITTEEAANVTRTSDGYKWNVGNLKHGEVKTLKYKLTLKDDAVIDDGQYLYHEVHTSESIVANYDVDKYESNTIDSQQFIFKKDYSPTIQICDKYSVTIKAVSEEDYKVGISGIQFKVIAKDSTNNVIYNQELTTDRNGQVVVDNLTAVGQVHFEIIPTIDEMGYADTDRALIDITNTHGKDFTIDSVDWQDPTKTSIDNKKRNININIPIATDKFTLEVRLSETNNTNVHLSNSEFRLIQPKASNTTEFLAKFATTNTSGKCIFRPSIMTKSGTYDYVLTQMTCQDGYYSMGDASIKVTFDNNGNIVYNGVSARNNEKVTTEWVDARHVIVYIANDNETEDTFGIELNLVEKGKESVKIKDATYDIQVTRTSNGKKVTTTYPGNRTNEKGKINLIVPGNGWIELKVKQTSTPLGYDLDSETKIITLNRVDGVVESVTQAYNEDSKTNIDARPYSGENKVIINLENTLQSYRNMFNVKLVDADENDVPLPGVDFRLVNNMTGDIYNGTTGFDGIASFRLPTEDPGIYNYTIQSVSGLPTYYNTVNNASIAVEFGDNGELVDVSNAWLASNPGIDPVIDIDEPQIVSSGDYADYTSTVYLGASVNAANTFIFRVELTAEDTHNAQEGAEFDILMETGSVQRNITGRKTNANGRIETRIMLDNVIVINVTQTEAVTKYKKVVGTKEIILHYNETTNAITLDNPTDTSVTKSGNIITYSLENNRKSGDDVYLEFTVTKEDRDSGAAAAGMPLHIYQVEEDSSALIYTKNSTIIAGSKYGNDGESDPNKLKDAVITSQPRETPITVDHALDVTVATDNDGTVSIGKLKVANIPVSGEGEAVIYVEEIGTTAPHSVRYHLTYRYNQYTEAIELTNVEITQGIKNVKEGSREFSGRETSLGYESRVTSTQYADLEDTGNLVLDVKQQDSNGNILPGAAYDVQIIQPNHIGDRVYKSLVIQDGIVEFPGIIASEGTEIIFKQVDAPIGYAKSSGTQILRVDGIDGSGEINLELQPNNDPALSASLPLDKKVFSPSSMETGVTEYTLIFSSGEMETFKIVMNVIDAKTNQPVQGYGFKVISSTGYQAYADASDAQGRTEVIIGPNYKDTEGVVTYTITKDATAQYYQPIQFIDLLARFTANRKIAESTKTMQTSTTYGQRTNGGKWYIQKINQVNGDIVMDVYVDKYDPVTVEIDTIDRITEVSVPDVDYRITPNLGTNTSTPDPATRTAITKISYPDAGKVITYRIENTAVTDYQTIADQELVITYDSEGVIDPDPTKTYATTDNLIIDTISGNYIKLVTKVDPRLKVNVTTKDYITGAVIKTNDSDTEVTYTITDPTGYSSQTETEKTVENGFIAPGQADVIYTIKQDRILSNFEIAEQKAIKITYGSNGHITGATSDDNYITIDSYNKNEINVTVYNEPRQGIYIENYDYYTNAPISGAEFEFISGLDESRTPVTLVVGSDGQGDILGSRLGQANSTVRYRVRQTNSNPEYAKLKDFDIEITYGPNREIVDVQEVGTANAKWLTATYIQPSREADRGYNGNNKGIVKLVIRSNYSFRINVTNLDRLDNSNTIANTAYDVVSTIDTTGSTVTGADGTGTAYVDRTEENRRVVYTITETAEGAEYQKLEGLSIDVEVEFDENGYVKIGYTNVVPGRGDQYAYARNVTAVTTIKDNFTIFVTITNLPKFRVSIKDIDRLNNAFVIAGTTYQITSEIGDSVSDAVTNNDGVTLSRVHGNTAGKEVIYTLHEVSPSTEFQPLYPDIKFKVKYKADGTVDEASIVDGEDFATIKTIETPTTSFEKLKVEMVVTNAPKFRVNITNIDRDDMTTKIQGTQYSITSDVGGNIDTLQTGTTGEAFSRIDGVTQGKQIVYTIHEDKATDYYQDLEQDIKIRAFFDGNGELTNAEIIEGGAYATVTMMPAPVSYTSFEEQRIEVVITNNPVFKINIFNGDRVTNDPLKETLYTITRDTDEPIELGRTNTNGVTQYKSKETVHGETSIYTIHEVEQPGAHQRLEEDIKVEVTFKPDGKIDTYNIIQGSHFATINKDEHPTSSQENFTLHMTIVNNPLIKLHILNGYMVTEKVVQPDGSTLTVQKLEPIEGSEYKIDAALNSNGTFVETINEQATGPDGKTTFGITKGLTDKTIRYTITETHNVPGFERIPSNVELTVGYDSDGRIIATAVGSPQSFVSITNIDSTNFEISMTIISEPTPLFGVNLSVADMYDQTVRIEGVKANAYLLDSNDREDSKYLLPDIETDSMGIGYGYADTPYKDLNKTHRVLELRINSVPASYQNVSNGMGGQDLRILVDVIFSADEGRVLSTTLRTGWDSTYRQWRVDNNMVQVFPLGYGVGIKLNLYPALRLRLHAQDMYTGAELSAGLFLSTSSYPTGRWSTSDVVQQGWIGNQYVSYWNQGDYPYGTHFCSSQTLNGGATAENAVLADQGWTKLARTETVNNGYRTFYLYENSEPGAYQRYRPIDPIHYYNQRLIATIRVKYDSAGKITDAVVSSWNTHNGSGITDKYIKITVDHENNRFDVAVQYIRVTTMNINIKDGISKTNLSGIRVYPFNNGNVRYNAYNTVNYESTNGAGDAGWRYWGVNIANSTKNYVIGTQYYGTGFGGYYSIGNIEIQINYNENGIIQSATARTTGNAKVSVSWTDCNLQINIETVRRFFIEIDAEDMYDSRVNPYATFDIENENYSHEVVSGAVSRRRFAMGEIRPGEIVKYVIRETTTTASYLPTPTINMYVDFKNDGSIQRVWTDTATQQYFSVIYKAYAETGKKNESGTDLKVQINKIPSFVVAIDLSDKFYPSYKLRNTQFTLENSKGDSINGNIVTNDNGYYSAIIGRPYPNETVRYRLNQTSVLAGYTQITDELTFDVTFNGSGYIADYTVVNPGADGVLNIPTATYRNKRNIVAYVSNLPKYVNLGILNVDDVTDAGINDVEFEVTAEDLDDDGNPTGTPYQFNVTTATHGSTIGMATATLDDVEASADYRDVRYTIKQLNVPNTYRKIEDIVFVIRYNTDGSISYHNVESNNSNAIIQVNRKGTTLNTLNGVPVNAFITIKNNNAYDIIIKDEDVDYPTLGIEGTRYTISVDGTGYTKTTDSTGVAKVPNLKGSGDITIRIAEVAAGAGYRTDITNDTTIKVHKGETVYSLTLDPTEPNSNPTKATVNVNEEQGTITVTFKNETKHEIGISKYDVNTNASLRGAKFVIKRQEVDASGNNIGDIEMYQPSESGYEFGFIPQEYDITGNLVDNQDAINNASFETNASGYINVDLGKTLQNKRFVYTIEEVKAPEEYDLPQNAKVNIPVTFDMYGKITSVGPTDNWRGAASIMSTNPNGIIVSVANGDPNVPGFNPNKVPYRVRVVTEDGESNKRINGATVDITMTKDVDGVPTQINHVNAKSADVMQGTYLLERGVVTSDYTQAEGIVTIDINETPGVGYDRTTGESGTIKLDVSYVDNATGTQKLVKFDVIDDGGFGSRLVISETKGQISVTIKNSAVVQLGINASYAEYITNNINNTIRRDSFLPEVKFRVTSEVQSSKTVITTDLDVTSDMTDIYGNIKIPVGKPYPGKTVLYTISSIKPNMPTGYKDIDEIVLLVRFDTNGDVKYSEVLTSGDVAKIVNQLPTKRILEADGSYSFETDFTKVDPKTSKEVDMMVFTQKDDNYLTYRVVLEQHNNRDGLYNTVIPGTTYRIQVEEEFGESREWIATTSDGYTEKYNNDTGSYEKVYNPDLVGKIISPEFSGYGKVKVTYTELEAADGYERNEFTHTLEVVRNRTTKAWDKLIHNDDAYDYTSDISELKVMPQNAAKSDRFDFYVNKIDQMDSTRITSSPAIFELSLIEEQIIMDDSTLDPAAIDPTAISMDGTGSEVPTSTTVSEIETLLGTQSTLLTGKLSFDKVQMPTEPGTYRYHLQEITAPTGYASDADGFDVNITFRRTAEGALIISDVTNASSQKTKMKLEVIQTQDNQLVAVNIKNTKSEDAILDGQYSLDITKVDRDTNEPITESALFKVVLPDNEATEVYTETAKSYMGDGKLEYCYIEQGKDYNARLTHMTIPTLPTATGNNVTTVRYVFKEVVPPAGYVAVPDDLILEIEFTYDAAEDKTVITNVTSSDDNYLRINNDLTQLPFDCDTPLSIDILNGLGTPVVSLNKITYHDNDNGDGIPIVDMPDPLSDTKAVGTAYTISSATPTKEGYIFRGWSDEPTATVATYQPGDLYVTDADLDLYAVWEEKLKVSSTEYFITGPSNIDVLLGRQKQTTPLWQQGDLSEYEEGDLYIKGIASQAGNKLKGNPPRNAGTGLADFLSKLTTNADDVKVYMPKVDGDGNRVIDEDNEITNSAQLMGTGMIVKFTKGLDQEITLTIIARGDFILNGLLTGDGALKNTDINYVKQLSNKRITSEFSEINLEVLNYYVGYPRRWNNEQKGIFTAYNNSKLSDLSVGGV